MKKKWMGVFIIVTGVATAAIAAGGTSVYLNGTKASTRVRMISGAAYVPLADVAKAYDAQVVKRADGDFEIIAAGGANQVGKYQGKIGQEVFTGQYKFSVGSVEEVPSYATKYRTRQDIITTDNPSQKLVVVHCRIKNGTPVRQMLLMTVGGKYGSPNTALTDTDEQSYKPMSWHGNESYGGVDVHEDATAPAGTAIIPGAACNVNLIFLVPKDTKPKDLVFSITPYSEYSKGDQKKFTDVRISLNTP